MSYDRTLEWIQWSDKIIIRDKEERLDNENLGWPGWQKHYFIRLKSNISFIFTLLAPRLTETRFPLLIPLPERKDKNIKRSKNGACSSYGSTTRKFLFVLEIHDESHQSFKAPCAVLLQTESRQHSLRPRILHKVS